MTKYIIGKFFSSGGATLCKNPSDQTVLLSYIFQIVFNVVNKFDIFIEAQIFFSLFNVQIAKLKCERKRSCFESLSRKNILLLR